MLHLSSSCLIPQRAFSWRARPFRHLFRSLSVSSSQNGSGKNHIHEARSRSKVPNAFEIDSPVERRPLDKQGRVLMDDPQTLVHKGGRHRLPEDRSSSQIQDGAICYLQKVWGILAGTFTVAGAGIFASVTLNTAAFGPVAIYGPALASLAPLLWLVNTESGYILKALALASRIVTMILQEKHQM